MTGAFMEGAFMAWAFMTRAFTAGTLKAVAFIKPWALMESNRLVGTK